MYVDYTYAATTGADGSFRAARYEYDSSGLLSRVSSESSVANRTLHTDTALNQIATITDVNNQSSTFEYGNRGQLIKTTSLNGAASTYTRNASGRITQQTTLNGVSRYEYHLAGRLLKSTQANGDTYVNTFDACGKLMKLSIPSQIKSEFAYDAVCNTTHVKDGLGRSTSITNDALNRPTSLTATFDVWPKACPSLRTPPTAYE